MGEGGITTHTMPPFFLACIYILKGYGVKRHVNIVNTHLHTFRYSNTSFHHDYPNLYLF